jgi:hypothetical protein
MIVIKLILFLTIVFGMFAIVGMLAEKFIKKNKKD